MNNTSAPRNMEIALPLGNHNGVSLRNLFNLVYSRAPLINRATGSHFHVDKSLVDALRNDACTYTVANFRKALAEYEAAHGATGVEGLLLAGDKIVFSGFPTDIDLEHLTAYARLAVLMNNQALMQRRVQAKTVRADNERYAMHVWLIRLGMIGDDFKATRQILMERLTGSMAFRTEKQKYRAQRKARPRK